MWKSWGNWADTVCTKTCGGGIHTRLRSCNSPSPENGGQQCLVFDKTERDLTDILRNHPCNTQPCAGEYYYYSNIFSEVKEKNISAT